MTDIDDDSQSRVKIGRLLGVDLYKPSPTALGVGCVMSFLFGLGISAAVDKGQWFGPFSVALTANFFAAHCLNACGVKVDKFPAQFFVALLISSMMINGIVWLAGQVI